MNESNETLVQLTADIVAAHVSNNSVAVGDLGGLIGSVHAALTGLGGGTAEAVSEKPEPAVSVRASIKPEAIVCLECGAKQRMLKRHLHTAHGLTPAEYRARFDLKADYPMVAPNYSEQRRTLAHAIGLGRKPSAGQPGTSRGGKKAGAAKSGNGNGRGRPRKAAEPPAS